MKKSDFIGKWESSEFDINLNENSLEIIWKKGKQTTTSGNWYIENENLVLSYFDGNSKRLFSIIKLQNNSLILKDLNFGIGEIYNFSRKSSFQKMKLNLFKKAPILLIQTFVILIIGVIIASLINFGLIDGLLFLLIFGFYSVLYIGLVFGGCNLINYLFKTKVSDSSALLFYFTTTIVVAYYLIFSKIFIYVS